MTGPTPPVPEDSSAASRRWRVWASVAIGGFTVVAIVFGFFVISSRGGDGVADAIGIGHRHDTAVAFVSPVPPPTLVAWTNATLSMLEAAIPDNGQAVFVQNCAACHGENGIAVGPTFPNLAGQHRTAIYKQLRDYSGGQRSSPIMASMAALVDDGQMADIAAYLASLEPAPQQRAAGTPSDIVALTTTGDPARGLPPCGSCHGARGGPQGTPSLDGQPAGYLQLQLEAFASGARGNDIYALMRTIAAMLTQSEIEQLAGYYGQ